MKANQPEQGMQIALDRIAQEAQARTGFLDLGRLGLTVLPDELFELRHLNSLNLGYGFLNNNKDWVEAASDIAPNDLGTELSRLATFPELQYLCVELSDLTLLSGLTGLQTLDCSDTAVSDLTPLSSLTELQMLDCTSTAISDLAPLSGLTKLKTLHCSGTAVSDLAPLSGLTGLQRLDCSNTAVSDLAPLSGLTGLQHLDCMNTSVSDLAPLSGLTELQHLDCMNTSVSDLAPLSGLTELQHLDCMNTSVSDLAPLSGLTKLKTLHCSDTAVSDLAPLSGLTKLKTLDCTNTAVSDLAPLSGLAELQTLDFINTSVSDLTPLSGLTWLQTLDFSHCKLQQFPKDILDKPLLQALYLYQTRIPSIPAEVLSRSFYNNCLERLRAHVQDLEAGSATVTDIKMMILGNGRVGKTQISRRLRGEDYDGSVDSTHGIIINSTSLQQNDGTELARLNCWDFGGQDIYHGTHALFMKTRAAFLIVWATESENAVSHEHGGMLFRNHPLDYWLAYVRHLAGQNSPVLVVQTRCDRPENEARRLPVADEELNGFPFFKFLHYSALNNRGRAALDESLREAVNWLREQQGLSVIGAGRLRVQRRLETLREADLRVPEAQRQYRTLSQEHFRAICGEAGGVSSPEHCLDYLHNSGVVFYEKGLFEDRIVLDQAWALEAIYTVFHREKCYRELKRLGGRFSRSLLELLVWPQYSTDEQQLFLDMMQSCGICFVHKKGDSQLGLEDEYIAPELLPDKAELAAELAEKWNDEENYEEAVYRYELHHPGLLRSLMADIGTQAGVNGLYWQGGVCVFEKRTRSHALIEQESDGGWSGSIRIRTQGGQAAELLSRFNTMLTEQNYRWGLQPMAAPEPRAVTPTQEASVEQSPEFEFVQEPKQGVEYCVSYAWGDGTPEGKERDSVVDKLCQLATEKDIRILRDKQDLKLGDQLSKFMQRIGQGDRIFVIISDKYLKSPNCMYELFEIWRNSRQEPGEFLQRVRIYSTPCARIFSVSNRLGYAIYWKKEHEAIKGQIDEYGANIMGVEDFKAFKLMDEFAAHVGDVLTTVADTIHARSFEDLKEYGFDEK